MLVSMSIPILAALEKLLEADAEAEFILSLETFQALDRAATVLEHLPDEMMPEGVDEEENTE